MQREVTRFASEVFDVLVIGGGIYGATVAYLASLQGLRVGLIEQQDFGHATSANSLKVMHGGLRYLQHADIRRMRESMLSRRWLFSLVPHLVEPLACLRPTYGYGVNGKQALAVALAVNDVIAWDRNRGIRHDKRLPRGRTISRQECLRIVPGISGRELNGAALWYDGIATNTERITLWFVQTAEKLGASVANYVRAERYLVKHRTISGVLARDWQSGDLLEIRAKTVINTGGPWVDLLSKSLGQIPGIMPSRAWAKAINIVVRRSLFPGYAVGLSGRRGYSGAPDGVIDTGKRDFFFVPWREHTMIGTLYFPYHGDPGEGVATAEELELFIRAINALYPAAELDVDDICFVHAGLLAAQPNDRPTAEPTPTTQAAITDPRNFFGYDGLCLVNGVKFTTAYSVADRVVRLVMGKLGYGDSHALRSQTGMSGNDDSTSVQLGQLDTDIVDHLGVQYGVDMAKVITPLLHQDCQNGERIKPHEPTIRAEVRHAVREEMALHLSDVILRRTDLGTVGHPGLAILSAAARIMAKELKWTKTDMASEISAVEDIYKNKQGRYIS